MPQQLISISAAADGSVWGIDPDGTLLKAEEGLRSWRSVVRDKHFNQVSVGGARIWCIDANGRVFRSAGRAGGIFSEVPGAELVSIGVGADGTVCGIDRTGQALRYDEAGTWSPMPSSKALAKVTVGNAHNICAVDTEGQAYHLVADRWEQIGLGFSDISTGPDEALWALGPGGNLFYHPGDEWLDTGKTFQAISAGQPLHLWGIDVDGNTVDQPLYLGCCCGPRRITRSTPQVEPMLHAAGRAPRPLFAADDVFDEAKSTHLWIVKKAAELAAKQGKIGQEFYKLFQPNQKRVDPKVDGGFHDALCQGVYDADYLPEYNSPVFKDGKWSALYKSHFYDPDSGKNWLGETDPTALTMGRKLFNDAVIAYHVGKIKEAGYWLGLSLHYLTDLGQQCMPPIIQT